MLEQQRLRDNGTDAVRAEEFRDGYEQADRKEQQIAHERNGSTRANPCKTVRQHSFRLRFSISHPTG
jgi:hypothetical protein